jgi:hypothetical protein
VVAAPRDLLRRGRHIHDARAPTEGSVPHTQARVCPFSTKQHSLIRFVICAPAALFLVPEGTGSSTGSAGAGRGRGPLGAPRRRALSYRDRAPVVSGGRLEGKTGEQTCDVMETTLLRVRTNTNP